MEARSYDFFTFFSEVVFGWKSFGTTDGEIYISDEYVWKVFSSSLKDDRKNEDNLERLAKLDPNMFTIPIRKLYLDKEYYGFQMNNAGLSLEKYILKNNPSLDEKIYILEMIKRIVDFLKENLLLHGDIRIQNVMVDKKDDILVRLCDINNLIYPNTTYTYINNLHAFWQEFYRVIGYIDKLGFDLITFILVNFSNEDIVRISDEAMLIDKVRCLLDYDNGYFKKEEFELIKHDLVCKDKEKRLKMPNTYLIDCLK